MSESNRPCTAFAGVHRIAAGALADVAGQVKAAIDQGASGSILIFDDLTSEQIEIDFHGTATDVGARLAERERASLSADPAGALDDVPGKDRRGPGRPKLGVVAREVTLLPRHWDWLNRQPGGASVALRKLVEEARGVHADRERVRQAQESAYRFMSAMAGNLPGFEEAIRALFAGQRPRFDELTQPWPTDIRTHAQKLATSALPS